MEHQEFDDLARVLATSGSRRGAVGALAGLLGLGLLGAEVAEGKSKQQRRQQRRRKHQERRKDKRDAQAFLSGIKLTVENPFASGQAVDVEFGYATFASDCCQGEAAYTIKPGESRQYTTGKPEAYLWAADQYFIDLTNPLVGKPTLKAAYNGAGNLYQPYCCKKGGITYYSHIPMDVEETIVLDFGNRHISVFRNEDEPEYKSFFVRL